MERTLLETQVIIDRPVNSVWEAFTLEEHIVGWNFAHESWHCPKASNDLREGGRFNYRMEARDGSFGFDFTGEYEEVKPFELIRYHLDDGRQVEVSFLDLGDKTQVNQTFEAEQSNPADMQQAGWQEIADNFSRYGESL